MQVWIRIQNNTFRNWVNVTLQDTGKKVESFEEDFRDGTVLVALVEKLQKRRLRHNKRPQNQHHELENISIALDAIKEDGIKLVNIGKDNHRLLSSFFLSFFDEHVKECRKRGRAQHKHPVHPLSWISLLSGCN